MPVNVIKEIGLPVGKPVRDPFATDRRPLCVGDTEVTVPLPYEVQNALNKASEAFFEQVRAALEPFGLHPYDIAAPEYRRVIYVDEVQL